MSDSYKVILVDDDKDVLKTLELVFKSAGFSVITHARAGDFLDSLPSYAYTFADAAVVLDLRMPQISGLEVLNELKRRNNMLPVIVYSSHADVEATVRVFEDGAYTLIQKPASKNLLVEKVKEAISRHRDQLKRSAECQEAKLRLTRLSPREREIAELLARGKSAREIGEQIHLSTRTVETHRKNIFAKTEVSSSAELARLQTLSELA